MYEQLIFDESGFIIGSIELTRDSANLADYKTGVKKLPKGRLSKIQANANCEGLAIAKTVLVSR